MMGDERLTEGSIYDIKFAYNSKPVGYTTSMSHMNELYAIVSKRLKKEKNIYSVNIYSVNNQKVIIWQ